MVASLGDGDTPSRAWVCLGSPCVGVYVPVFVDAPVRELADAGEWERFARLRTRVESDDDALEAVRSTLGDVETALWDDADAAFASGDQAPRVDFAARAWKPVDAALRRLGV
jgi:hypothetical protein